jgi:hypothetical protein
MACDQFASDGRHKIGQHRAALRKCAHPEQQPSASSTHYRKAAMKAFSLFAHIGHVTVPTARSKPFRDFSFVGFLRGSLPGILASSLRDGIWAAVHRHGDGSAKTMW